MGKLIVLGEHSDARASLILNLKALGYDVEVSGYRDVVARVSEGQVDLIAWTVDTSSFQALAELRSLTFYPPLLAVSETEEPDKVATLLECGCDGILTKSRDILQLKAWVNALLRRRDMYQRVFAEDKTLLRIGDLEIDVLGRMVRTKSQTAELTDREMRLLLELAQKPGQVCTRAELLENIWGSVAEALTGTLNSHINKLRTKIEDDPRDPKYIIGIYGIGYKLVRPSALIETSGKTNSTEVDTSVEARLKATHSALPAASSPRQRPRVSPNGPVATKLAAKSVRRN